jgi:hypothetical protein
MQDTSGFYKLDGELLYAPNFVLGPYQAYSLHKQTHSENEYPIDGWFWFDSEQEAKAYFGIPYELSESTDQSE